MKKLVWVLAILVCFSGCSSDEVEETQTQTTATVQTTETAKVTSVTETAVLETEQTTESVQLEEFNYPENPLASADDLMNLVFAAKERLVETGEIYIGMAGYNFGVIDVDFDGFPEIYCVTIMGGYQDCVLYSLKEENFCEKLLEYKVFFPTEYEGNYGETKYMVKDNADGKRIVLYVDFAHVHQNRNLTFSEITVTDGVFYENKIGGCYWGEKSYDFDDYDSRTWDDEYWLRMYGEPISHNNRNAILEEYFKDVTPANYVHEPVDYDIRNICDVQKFNDNYDLLHEVYDNYLKTLNNTSFPIVINGLKYDNEIGLFLQEESGATAKLISYEGAIAFCNNDKDKLYSFFEPNKTNDLEPDGILDLENISLRYAKIISENEMEFGYDIVRTSWDMLFYLYVTLVKSENEWKITSIYLDA